MVHAMIPEMSRRDDQVNKGMMARALLHFFLFTTLWTHIFKLKLNIHDILIIQFGRKNWIKLWLLLCSKLEIYLTKQLQVTSSQRIWRCFISHENIRISYQKYVRFVTFCYIRELCLVALQTEMFEWKLFWHHQQSKEILFFHSFYMNNKLLFC